MQVCLYVPNFCLLLCQEGGGHSGTVAVGYGWIIVYPLEIINTTSDIFDMLANAITYLQLSDT